MDNDNENIDSVDQSQIDSSDAKDDGASSGGSNDSTTKVADSAVPPPPQKLELSQESIQALANSLAPKDNETQQLSQEQIDKLLDVYNISQEDAEALGLQPTALPHLQRLFDAKTKQAMKAAAVQVEYIKRTLLNEIAPLKQMVAEYQTERLIKRFYAENEDLVGKESLVEAVYAKLNAANALKGKSPEETFKIVADNTRQVITTVAGSNNGAGKTASVPSGRKPSTTLVGGQSGAGSGGKAAAVSPQQALAQQLFPRRR